MGDWCGSKQVEPWTDQKEITGADRNENDVVLLWVKSIEKNVIFFQGEVFFFLTDPLMGDPFFIDYPFNWHGLI